MRSLLILAALLCGCGWTNGVPDENLVSVVLDGVRAVVTCTEGSRPVILSANGYRTATIDCVAAEE